MANHREVGEEFSIFFDRFLHFMNLWTVYSDLTDRHYVPSRDGFNSERGHHDSDGPRSVRGTVLQFLCAYFDSLIEDKDDCIDGFRIWRSRYPDEQAAINAVEARVEPFKQRLRWFRNRVGFHGSRTRSHESKGYELFRYHTPEEVFNAMSFFAMLGALLLAKEDLSHGGTTHSEQEVRACIDSIAAGKSPACPR